jgi:type IV secretory pathway VirB3-like protein
MSQRRVGSKRMVTIVITVICLVLAIFATVAWMQDSTYGVVAVALWVITLIAVVADRRRARDRRL